MIKDTNQYISYPYPFEIPLSIKRFYSVRRYRIINFNINNFVQESLYHLNWNNFKKEVDRYKNTAEKILSIFLNEEIILGNKKNIHLCKPNFLKKINFFIKKNQPILFNITQFAFKVPNPLKTNRRKPDLGELAFLSQLKDIVNLIKKIYSPGAKIIIYGESYVFNSAVEINFKEIDIYFKTIKKWISQLGWENDLILYDLRSLVKQIPNFQEHFQTNLKLLRQGWFTKDKSITSEIRRVTETLFLSINTRRYSIDKVMDLYNQRKITNKFIKAIRDKLLKKAITRSFSYLAYHKSINTSRLSELLFPNSLKLSFTFGSDKICLHTINKESRLYPYHGVPILNEEGKVVIKFEIDVLRKKKISAFYIDHERTPYFYKII